MSTAGTRGALLDELSYYERTGNKDRAKQVQAQLDLLDAPPTPPEPVSVTDAPGGADDPEERPVRKPRAKK